LAHFDVPKPFLRDPLEIGFVWVWIGFGLGLFLGLIGFELARLR
jgi:hypothetical protein